MVLVLDDRLTIQLAFRICIREIVPVPIPRVIVQVRLLSISSQCPKKSTPESNRFQISVFLFLA